LRGLVAALFLAPAVAAAAPAVHAVDGAGQLVPLGAARASLQRTPPAPAPELLAHGDPDALRYLLAGEAAELPEALVVESLDETGRALDRLDEVTLERVACPPSITAPACAVTAPIRAALDDVDAQHPLVGDRSLRAVLGGTLRLQVGETVLGSVRVTGPRSSDVARWRAKLRFVLVRLTPGGSPPVGGDHDGAVAIAREAATRAGTLWGACGIGFGPPEELSVTIVDPPPAHLVAVGCDHGLPASGGRLRVMARKKLVQVSVARGTSPAVAARRLARAIAAQGLRATVADVPRMAGGAGGASDVSVRTPAGELVELTPPPDGVMSTDPTLPVCLGAVDLTDGLQHFGDADATGGTVEERALVGALDDRDPTTIDVYLVPAFGGGGRVGESFIGADGGSIRNAVVVDRAGIRSSRASNALAHELGHVLLDDPGHTDDAGPDTPTSLMDADNADPSAFGPRRLSLEECARAVAQSGPAAPVPLLEPWPLSL
jgi:hypothetical protein